MRQIVAVVIVAPLLMGANAPSRIEKMARILSLEDRRTTGGGELASYLRDADRSVRRRACLAAGRIGDATAMRPLLGLLDDVEPEVRQVSAFALGLIGDTGAVPRLRTTLKDRDALVRSRAAEALGRIGDRAAAPDIARMILDALPKANAILTIRGDDPGNPKDPWLELRLGLFALARLKDVPAAESVLLSDGAPRFDWWAAAYAAAAVESPSLQPVLAGAVSSGDPLVRAFAALGLGALPDAASLDTLATLVRDKEESVAVAALEALGRSRHVRATDVAAGALGSQNLTVRLAALDALGTLPVSSRLVGALVPLVGHEQPAIRVAALRVLARADRQELALVLSGLGEDATWSVKVSVARALGTVKDEIARNVLASLAEDPDPRVRAAAVSSLGPTLGADALPVLTRHLADPDPAVRTAAAVALASTGARGTAAALAKAYAAARADADPGDRLALVAGLAAANTDEARAALRDVARDDPSRAVRVAAAARLRAAGADVSAPGSERGRPPVDYHLAMAPFDPQPDQPLYTPRVFLRTRHGAIEIHLNILEAPLACDAFMSLGRRGFYNGLPIERVIPGARLEAGSPRGDGRSDVGYALRGEMGLRPFGRGSVGLIGSGDDAGGSRFFITLRPDPRADGEVTLIGTVVNGIEVVEKLRPEDEIDRVDVWDGR